MQRNISVRIVAVLGALLALPACGDDDEPAADGGDSGAPRAGRDAGPQAGKGGTGGGGSKADAGVDAGGGEDAGPAAMQSVTIRFAAKLGDRALNCGEFYDMPSLGGARVTPTDFRFFVQEVRLVTASGREEPVSFDERAPVQTRDVAVIDFTDERGACAAGDTAHNTMITGKVAPGDYTAIVFVNGVPESVNHQDIVEAKPPLHDTSTYWGWTTGYRFVLSALSVQTDDVTAADGGSVLVEPGNSFVHVGAGGCAGATTSGFTCSRPNRNRIELGSFDPRTNVIVADLAKIFAGVDLTRPIECHGPSTPRCGPAYVALGLNPADGSARDGQDVFRVE